MDNYSFDVFRKIEKEERGDWRLYIDAVYRADPTKKNLSAEVLSKLLGVKNQGGFRYLGKTESPDLIMLFSSGEDIYWRDELDNNIGLFLYYGDNKTPGTDLHKTNLHGNQILRNVFAMAASDGFECRKRIPPILVFKKQSGRDVKFLGLAVPGIKGKPSKDWLTAVWGSNKEGDRFQNYKAFFTIVDTASGSDADDEAGICLAWLTDIENGNAYDSIYAPKAWKQYIKRSTYVPLVSPRSRARRTKADQLPSDTNKKLMLSALQKYFYDMDKGYSFERFAAYLIECMDEAVVNIDVTRPYKDGGFDAEGRYRIFKNVENTILVNFYMQAKCYSPDIGVQVSDTSRLISRIKDRQFGIIITTSYIGDQAYKEILDDGHPIVIITGKDIIDHIFNEMEIRDPQALLVWLDKNYG